MKLSVQRFLSESAISIKFAIDQMPGEHKKNHKSNAQSGRVVPAEIKFMKNFPR